MMVDAGLDNPGHDTGERDAAQQDKTGFSNGESRARAEPNLPDARKLAQDWITLWQSELTAMAADPEMRESWQTIMALWAGTMSTILRGMPRARGAERAADRHDRPGGQARTADAPGAAAAAAAPDARDAEIERLARHVAALERRLADVERGGNSPVDPKRRPGRRPAK